MATALAGWRLAINPFDQPDVEAAKVLARRMIARYRQEGAMPAEAPALSLPDWSVYGAVRAADPAAALRAFLGQAVPGAYIAIQAFLCPCPETGAALEGLRAVLRDRFRLPVTVGYGPRFLHSTGQLHKGDAGRGLFLQLTADDPRDVPIPDEPGRPDASLTFGILKAAQAFGDRQALHDAGRRVLRLHRKEDPAAGIARLAAAL
jgi:glucose-6-phosphate isomerase/transaldolase/glucose-6-phosphate isomerase